MPTGSNRERPVAEDTPGGLAAYRVRLIGLLAPFLDATTLPHALNLVAATYNGDFSGAHAQATQLGLLAPFLADESLDRAVTLALEIWHYPARARALGALARVLDVERYRQVLGEVAKIEQINRYGETAQWAVAIQALARYLPVSLQPEGVRLAETVQIEQDRAETLIALAPFLNEGARAQAQEAVLRLQDPRLRARVLSQLPGVGAETIRRAIAEAVWYLRDAPLPEVIDFLADEQLWLVPMLSPDGRLRLFADLAIWRSWRWTLSERQAEG